MRRRFDLYNVKIGCSLFTSGIFFFFVCCDQPLLVEKWLKMDGMRTGDLQEVTTTVPTYCATGTAQKAN